MTTAEFLLALNKLAPYEGRPYSFDVIITEIDPSHPRYLVTEMHIVGLQGTAVGIVPSGQRPEYLGVGFRRVSGRFTGIFSTGQPVFMLGSVAAA